MSGVFSTMLYNIMVSLLIVIGDISGFAYFGYRVGEKDKVKHTKEYREYVKISDTYLAKCRQALQLVDEIERIKPELKFAYDKVMLQQRGLN
jgi:Tfp pilus assembly protein PilO